MEARDYQIEIYEQSKDENVIIKLDTGLGKTFIASMLIKYYLDCTNNKKIILLVKNSSLAEQHANSLRRYLFLNTEVGLFYGDLQLDNWTKNVWSEKLSIHRIIVMTARVFLDILNHNKYNLDEFSFLIFDEVHHVTKSDDYVYISQHIARTFSNIRILGLTACLLKSVKKLKDVEVSIMELERALGCKIVTSFHENASELWRNCEEKIITYESDDFWDHNEFETTITEFNEIIKSLTRNGVEMEESLITSLKRYLSWCSSTLKNIGPYPSITVINIILEDMDCAEKRNQIFEEQDQVYMDKFISCLKSMKENICKEMKNRENFYWSRKCHELLKLVCDIQTKDQEKLNSILIFTDERIHAFALNELFLKLHDSNVLFKCLPKSMFITGHNPTKHIKKLNINVKKQTEILKAFKEKDFQILFATSVIEEGVDIPNCNIVIKFDPPKDFRSYIQSKGRARAENSKYIIFTPQKDQHKVENQLIFFKKINNEINDILKARTLFDRIDNNDDTICDSEFDFAPYGEKGPRITLNSAASVLNRYIGTLRCNGLIIPKIRYKYEMKSSYLTSLLLPMPSPYLDEIKGKPCSNKHRAKQFANLEACKILHCCEELDTSLLPINRHANITENLNEKIKSHQNCFNKPMAIKLSTNYQRFSDFKCHLYLYSIRYKPSVFSTLGINDISTFDELSSIGFLLNKPIHETQSFIRFPIFLVGGENLVEIRFEKKFHVNTKELSILLQCHEKLFTLYSQRIRKFNQNIKFHVENSKTSLIITILKNYEIDFLQINELLNKENVVTLTQNSVRTWVSSVIRPTYADREYGAFVVTEVCEDTNAELNILKNNMTYEQYFLKKYNIKLNTFDKSQPLIKAKRLTTILSCVHKVKQSCKTSKKLQKINEQEIFFIPSLTECICLSASLWTQICVFPTIHHRINQILLLEEFSRKINFIDFRDSYQCYQINFEGCNVSNILSNISAESYVDINQFVNQIFPCFVAKICHDKINLEQYEILGDCFLKFVTSKYLFHYSKITDNEGKLTQKRSLLISNRNLFNLAIKNGLEKYFFYDNFCPRKDYLPPLFVENITENYRSRLVVSMKDKHLADCVEALIGSILTNYGINISLKFLLWLGLPISPDNTDVFNIEALTPDIFLNLKIPQYISELENILNYRFKCKGYAVQAITHHSSIENRKFNCYQKLEFLGDSVIDFLITIFIMQENKNLTPGKITNLRSALVNNHTFAYLSVKWGFHKFLNYFDKKMFSVLPIIAEDLLSNQLNTKNEFLRKNGQDKVKVLGDIFESIAGAIFVDSDYNLALVWEIYKHLMDEPIKKFFNHIPRNKISILHEKYPLLKCSFHIEETSNLVKLTARLPDGRKFEKIERNKALCKHALAEELL